VPCHELALVLDSDREIPVLVHAAPIFVNEQQVGAVIAFQDISQLKADDRAKDDFLAVLSHELMTPLTCILGWGEVGLAHNTPEIIRQSLDVIVRNAQRQRRLITDLLDVSRIIHDKLSIQSTPLDLWQLTMQAIDQLQPPLRDRQLTLVRCPPQASALPVMADPDRMLQVINNLLNNAIKHTPAGGTITVTGSAEDGWAYVEIADTGQGLASELLSRIFLPFQQGEQYEANTGLGLGLALVRGIVELHGGRATAKSAGIGQGSAFTVALPLLTAPAAACTSLSTTGATRESVLN
jgi:signal transduction histidine kinase